MASSLSDIPDAAYAASPGARHASAPLRVLHVINGEDYSGAERVQDQLALRLADWGYEVGFACLLPGQFAAARQAQHVPLNDMPMRSRLDVRPIWRLARLIRRERYSVVHTHSARSVLVGRPAAAIAGVPIVHHMHCQTSTEVRRVWLNQVQAMLERVSLCGAAGIVAVSESLRDYLLQRGYSARKIWVVPNGVPTHGPVQQLRDRKAEWTLGTVALFRPRKGIDVLLDALAVLRSQGLPVRLRAVGRFQSAEYERQIRQRAHAMGLEGVIDWVGFQRDVRAELARMDCFVLPSLVAEAMPMSVLEAMAAGVIVVGSRVDGITDLVRDGETGLLANANDPPDLARALARLIRGQVDADAIRANAHRQQLERFSDSSMAAGIARLYDAILSPMFARHAAVKETL